MTATGTGALLTAWTPWPPGLVLLAHGREGAEEAAEEAAEDTDDRTDDPPGLWWESDPRLAGPGHGRTTTETAQKAV